MLTLYSLNYKSNCSHESSELLLFLVINDIKLLNVK